MANNIIIGKDNINIKSTVYDYFVITKPRVMLLSIFTAYTGVVIAASSIMSFNIFLVMISIAIGSGSAGAFNMALEGDTDSMMERTKNRPVAAKTIKKQDAILCSINTCKKHCPMRKLHMIKTRSQSVPS